MLIGVILAAFIAWTGAVWYTADRYATTGFETKIAAADAKLAAKDAKIEQDAANKLIDMDAAFTAGQDKAKVVYVNTLTKGQNYVASTPVFRDTQCVVPDDGVRFLNDARANLRTASDTRPPDAALPVTRAPPRRQTGDLISPSISRPGSVGTVPPKPRPIDSSGKVP